MRPKADSLLPEIYDRLYTAYGKIPCPLTHRTPFQLLVAVILSAQCTDKKVNSITPLLFKDYPDSKTLADADLSEIESIIRPIGLFRMKAKNLIGTARMIEERFNGKVPETMEELTALPGVGRKTANVILGNSFNIPGFPVDTHVKRIINRLGLIKSNSPEKIEDFVTKHLPPEYWTDFSHLLIVHGRKICKASKPDCGNCEIADCCAGKIIKK
jgi:endonuclease-3